ncbi:MAG: CoA transferase [Ardenticatenaceae bacterium]|nr:CoA transferase [Ardenticatenaceae bacterium]
MPGALSDLLVIDLTRVLAGPYGTMILGDLGARIVKIEQPGRGDDTRQWGPPFTSSGESAYFLCVNRNKQSLTLNLKAEAGREILRDLVRQADVLVENFKVGTMTSLGLGYESLGALNPGLIYCAITGYGQSGPYRKRPGYDTVIEAQGGIMSITGPPEGEPFKVGVAIVDITAGLYATTSILAALHHRERTGEGQFIDIALFDTQLGWLANVASAYLVSGEPPARYGNAHATIVPYQTVRTCDGWLMLAVGNDSQFAALSRVLDHPEWTADERFATNPARVANRETLIPQLEAIFRTRPTQEWIEAILDAGVPCGPVNDIPTALANPQAEARQMVQMVEHPVGGPVRLVGPVPKLSTTPATITTAPPMLGEHTSMVLRDLLGYDEARIAALRAAGII